MEAELKANAKNAIFERDFQNAFSKYLNQKQANHDRPRAEYTDDWKKYKLMPSGERTFPRFIIAGDNKFKSKKWASLMKDSAFYFDLPSIQEERQMRFQLQRNYDDLFEENWRPPLQSRRDLLTWSCEQHNAFLERVEGPKGEIEDCSNYS